MNKTVTVIGGGAAGMPASLFAARSGVRVVLLERNDKLGKKLYITGKGRCNVANMAENLMDFIPRNPRFLHAAFAQFAAADTRALLAAYGCETKVERGGRVFPQSDKASDVTRALTRALGEAGVEVRLGVRVTSLEPYLAQGAVVLATGGASYPATGSTGDGYALAEGVGHHVFPPRASLVPLETQEGWCRDLQGLSLKNVRLRAWDGRKSLFDELGEMLFTHFGVSGPLVLAMSSHILDAKQLSVSIDLKPALTAEQVEARLQREFDANPRKRVASVMNLLLPARMAEVFPIPRDTVAAQVTRAERARIAALLKALPITISGFRPLEEAIITRGGVDVREVDPSTMMSKIRPGLFFAGEILDVDAHTGGFNLQIAFSTGALAGRSAAGFA